MAGVKGKSGGKRSGAGRKITLPPEKLNTPIPIPVTEVAPSVDEIANKPREVKPIEVMSIQDMADLKCPIEFENMPFAKMAWEYIKGLDKESKIFNSRHFENLKSYCLAVELRQSLISEWEGQGKCATVTTRNGEYKVNPVYNEILRQSDRINSFASDLGLTVTGEFKVAKDKASSPKLSEEKKKNNSNLFG